MRKLINKIKSSINAKLQFLVIGSTFIVFFATIVYVSYKTRELAVVDTQNITKKLTGQYARIIENHLTKDFEVCKTLGGLFQDFVLYPDSVRDTITNNILKRTIQNNSHFISVWLDWELSAVIPNYPNKYGRVSRTYYRKQNAIFYSKDTSDVNGDDEDGNYFKIKTDKQDVITEPYWYSYSKGKTKEILETSICVPIMQSTNFVGLVGVDLPLDRFRKILRHINTYNDSYIYLISNKGTCVYSKDREQVGKNYFDLFKAETIQHALKAKFDEDISFSYVENIRNYRYFTSYAPIAVGDINTKWFLCVKTSYTEMLSSVNKNMVYSIAIGLVGVLLLSIVLYFISRSISRPLIKISERIHEIAEGNINDEVVDEISRTDEIGVIVKNVSVLNNNLFNTAQFAGEIGKGNLSVDFKRLSDNDVLSEALINMQKSLIEAKNEEDKRKHEDMLQRWAADGVAQINDLMRTNDDFNELAYIIVKFIVDYLKINQGSLFIADHDDENELYFAPVAVLAWGRKKPLKTKIKIGETLVGRAAFEKSTIYMKEIPEDYVKITSGLGKANPNTLLIVPLILNDDVLGVIELVSFNEFKEHEIKFVEHVAENIASVLSTVKINQRTNSLLDQTKIQAKELAEKEEELRQQMEEMKATQEETKSREAEMGGMINAINSIAYVAEYDMNGIIISVNSAYAKLLDMPENQIIGKKQGFLSSDNQRDKDIAFVTLWNKMKKGLKHKQVQKLNVNDKEVWISEVYTPIIDDDGIVHKVINIAIDISHLKKSNEI